MGRFDKSGKITSVKIILIGAIGLSDLLPGLILLAKKRYRTYCCSLFTDFRFPSLAGNNFRIVGNYYALVRFLDSESIRSPPNKDPISHFI